MARSVLPAALAAATLLATAPAARADDPFLAAQRGIDWLAGALCGWTETNDELPDCATGQSQPCFGCHSQGETVLGLARSLERCFTVPDTPCVEAGDEGPLEHAARHVADAQRKDCILGPFSEPCGGLGFSPDDPRTIDGFPPELGSVGVFPPCGSNALPTEPAAPLVQTVHGGMNLSGYARHVSGRYLDELVALAEWLLTRQEADGRFAADRLEPPVDQGDVFATGAAVIALATAEPRAAGPWRDALDAAAAWLRAAPLATNQDHAFALIGLHEAGVDDGDAELLRIRAALASRQGPGGGWAEREGLEPNAYATGQAVHALIETGASVDEAVICDGLDWLLRHQNPEGSWSLGEAGVSTDSTRNSDFTATTWPVLALGSLRPFGAEAGEDQLVESCLDEHEFTVELRNAADSVCGRHARLDEFALTVSNDAGDPVSVEPASLELLAGESALVTVRWERASARDRSTTTLTMSSLGGLAAGCPREASVALTVVGEAAAPVTALPVTMRLAREGPDLRIDWERLPVPVAGHELVRHGCRGDGAWCPVPPSHDRLDGAPARASAGASDESLVLPGEAAPGAEDALVYWKVRALDPCGERPGPTCNYPGCAHPLRCDSSCS